MRGRQVGREMYCVCQIKYFKYLNTKFYRVKYTKKDFFIVRTQLKIKKWIKASDQNNYEFYLIKNVHKNML